MMENLILIIGATIIMVSILCEAVEASEEISKNNWPSTETPIVLVHGAFGGAHDWRFVEKRLNEYGYEVKRASLTGLGERSHLISYQNDFTTHVEDVLTMLKFEYDFKNEDEQIILAGHSYGGRVVTAVASQIPEQIKKIIYIDALIPTSDDMMSGKELKEAEKKITPDDFLIYPEWTLYWEDPAGSKDVPHQRKSNIVPKSEFPKYEAMLKIPGTSMVFTGPEWKKGDELSGHKRTSYQVGKNRGYNIVIKSWGHNAHRERPDEFYPVFLEAIAKAK